MVFRIGNSFVALLFLVLTIIGIRQRAWMFAVMNFIGMALDALIVFLDLSGRLSVNTLFWAMPSLAFVLATAIILVFRQSPPAQTHSATAANAKAGSAETNILQEYMIVGDEKRLVTELRRDTGLATSSETAAVKWWKKGNAALAQNNFAEAEACYEQSLKSAAAASTLSNLAGVLIATNRLDAALRRCEQACARDGEHPEAWINHGCALFLLASTEEALACFDHATVLQPNLLASWIYRGRALRKLQRFQQAVECYDTALRINPNRAECWHEKGLTLVDLNKMNEAVKCFDHTLRLDPEHVYAALDRGSILERIGRVEQAKTSYRRFLQKAPPEMNGRTDIIRARLRQLENNPNNATSGLANQFTEKTRNAAGKPQSKELPIDN
ncbi:MAG: tetratricopeptide repeat protein [bacterium]